MKLDEVKKKYQNQWVLAKIIKESAEDDMMEVEVLAHSPDRAITYEAMRKTRSRRLYHFHAGPFTQKDYAIIL